jgi:hypothetical protein
MVGMDELTEIRELVFALKDICTAKSLDGDGKLLLDTATRMESEKVFRKLRQGYPSIKVPPVRRRTTFDGLSGICDQIITSFQAESR